MAGTANCPSCHKRLRPVSGAHVMRHLRGPYELEVSGQSYGFCTTPDCKVAFVGEGNLTYPAESLRWPAAYKTGNLDDLLCFCFNVTAKLAVSPGAAGVARFIKERVRSNDCACDILNPSTQCCLGSIATFRRDHERADGP